MHPADAFSIISDMNSILTSAAARLPAPETAAAKPGSRLEGRVAAVTGGAAGIGQAICLRLAAEGARVAVLDLDQGRAKQMVQAAGRLGTPAEVAATVAFLVSDDASYFVGATLSPDGGLVTAV